jgi:hypothetical protein
MAYAFIHVQITVTSATNTDTVHDSALRRVFINEVVITFAIGVASHARALICHHTNSFLHQILKSNSGLLPYSINLP